VRQVKRAWPKIDYETGDVYNPPHEAGMLRLDCSKALAKLQWRPVWVRKTAVAKTALWYRAFYESNEVKSMEDLHSYIADAKSKNIVWTEE
jgi:CDP-glucose 4,6-dehydratase